MEDVPIGLSAKDQKMIDEISKAFMTTIENEKVQVKDRFQII